MKTKSLILAAVAAVFLLTYCSGPKNEETASEDSDPAATDEAVAPPSGPQFEVEKTFQDQLARVLQGYLKVKDAFVATDPGTVKAEATSLKAVLKAIDTKMLAGQALNDWANYSNNLDMALAEIVASEDIEVQRTSFSSLSENLYKSARAFGLGGVTAYYEFCPMAFNDQGAYWLSDSKEIRNPYFGDKMLTCGRVTEELN